MQRKCKCPPKGKRETALRHIAYLLTLFLFMSFSMESFAQEKKISVEFNNEKAFTALRKVESLSGQRIQFNYKDVYFNVTLTAKNKTAFEVVQAIIQDHDLVVEKGKNDYLIIMRAPAKQQNAVPVSEKKSISGRVVDASGAPLPGVAVQIEGTTW